MKYCKILTLQLMCFTFIFALYIYIILCSLAADSLLCSSVPQEGSSVLGHRLQETSPLSVHHGRDRCGT